MILPLTPAYSPVAVEFFVRFSRFEFALKETGYLQNSADAKADWNKLTALPEFLGLSHNLEADPAALVLFERPPQKQVNSGASFSWRDDSQTEKKDMAWLCKMVRLVRNNLFHGGKDGKNGGERDEELLTASIHVLNQMLLTAPDDVRNAFDGKY
ncbi:MAG: hypothetical protein P4L57_06475 [Rhizomicrobium sp.]|nr:hypothetical protein [Rhizomicrobium sp.]